MAVLLRNNYTIYMLVNLCAKHLCTFFTTLIWLIEKIRLLLRAKSLNSNRIKI